MFCDVVAVMTHTEVGQDADADTHTLSLHICSHF